MSANPIKPVSSKVTIKIPGALYNRLSEIVADSGFNSVTDFIVYVLRDLASIQPETASLPPIGKENLSQKEIKAIRKRLKSLGYL